MWPISTRPSCAAGWRRAAGATPARAPGSPGPSGPPSRATDQHRAILWAGGAGRAPPTSLVLPGIVVCAFAPLHSLANVLLTLGRYSGGDDGPGARSRPLA